MGIQLQGLSPGRNVSDDLSWIKFQFLSKVGVSSHKTHVIKISKCFCDTNERAGAVKLLRDVR